jgi:uncharacterized membrane protein (UPF0127 family)
MIMEQRYIAIQASPEKVGVLLKVEVAFTESEKDMGLMFRDSLPETRGMLFVYEDEEELSFWMKNTHIPLTIAFIDEEGYILEIQDAKPNDETSITSSQPCKYGLEVNRGWFERKGLGVGAQLIFL